MTRPVLGVCYYPEHWPEERWTIDAARMAEIGLTWVRIGEFAWSRLEPEPGDFRFGWLARAIDTLHAQGLKVVLGTPTTTPPKWLVDTMPDMVPVDIEGRRRGFGSRRHHCFSHRGYAAAARSITERVAREFGTNPGVHAWQTDNEYGCHGTTLSYSIAARDGFRIWLAARYRAIADLNDAWGNVFWSMEYRGFDEIDLPNLTVTEANPSHWMDFYRYSSEQVWRFNRDQCEIIRAHSPGRPIIHNFMGRHTDFDHFPVGADLDIASWDSYPLGFLEERRGGDAARADRFARQGDPDFQGLHHDLYRACGNGRWWVMEQQPGPVNWAMRNPAPLPGMVRLWTYEAVAHGAECVSYFRWRQAPMGQEQMHAGLLRPDASEDDALREAEQVAGELGQFGDLAPGTAPAAILFDYESAWAWDIQPQGREFHYLELVLTFYQALRRLGIDVDIVSPHAPDLSGYEMVFMPGLFAWTPKLIEAVRACDGIVCIGPRSGSKTKDFQIPAALPPDLPEDVLPIRVLRVESLHPNLAVQMAEEEGGTFRCWHEICEGNADTVWETADGTPALMARGNVHYLAGWPGDNLAARLVAHMAGAAGVPVTPLPEGLRRRDCGDWRFYWNYGPDAADLSDLEDPGALVLDGAVLEPGGVAAIRVG